MKKIMKSCVVIGIAFMLFAITACTAKPSLHTITLTAVKEEVTINEKVEITVDTDPASVALPEEAFVTSGGKVAIKKGTLLFSADTVGTYTIYAQQDEIKSAEITITVKEKEAENVNEKPTDPTNSQEPVSIDTILDNPNSYLGKTVKVTGLLPQTLVENHAGDMVPVIWNDTKDEFFVLEGKKVDFGNSAALISGVLSYNGYDYIITVSEASQL